MVVIIKGLMIIADYFRPFSFTSTLDNIFIILLIVYSIFWIYQLILINKDAKKYDNIIVNETEPNISLTKFLSGIILCIIEMIFITIIFVIIFNARPLIYIFYTIAVITNLLYIFSPYTEDLKIFQD